MYSAKQSIIKMLVDEKANALRVLNILKDYPEPKIYAALHYVDGRIINGIDFVWGTSIYLSFTENRIKCLFYFDHQEETHDDIQPEGLIRILDEWKVGGSL